MLLLVSMLSACDQLGIETPDKINQRQEAEGKAIGAACRHAGRAIEDCYTLNPNANKAAAFEGWKEMNDYMRENKIDSVAPTIGPGVEGKGSKEGKVAKADKNDKATKDVTPTADEGPGPKPPSQFEYVPPKSNRKPKETH
jgi:hypothetical protein